MEELKFPLDFTSCPTCGGTRRIANEVLEAEREKGKVPKGIITCIIMQQTIIANPTGMWLSAPMVTSLYDTCVDCGTLYCFRAELKTIMPGQKPKPPAGGLFSKS